VDAATQYNVGLFIHVVGALGIAAAYTVDTVGLVGMRRAKLAEEAKAWLLTRRWVLFVGPPSIIVTIATGLYLMASQWGWRPWIVTSLAALVGIAVIGGVLTGIPMARIEPRIREAAGPLSTELHQALRAPALTISIATRISMTVGIAYLMALKPNLAGSLIVIVVAGAVGLGLAWLPGMRRESSLGAPS
jgi:hypothetical protein